MRKLVTGAVAVAFALAPVTVLAQDQESTSEGGVRYQKTTTIDFEADTIEGDLTKPDGEYVEARKRVNHDKLIRIREDFKQEVMESVSEL